MRFSRRALAAFALTTVLVSTTAGAAPRAVRRQASLAVSAVVVRPCQVSVRSEQSIAFGDSCPNAVPVQIEVRSSAPGTTVAGGRVVVVNF